MLTRHVRTLAIPLLLSTPLACSSDPQLTPAPEPLPGAEPEPPALPANETPPASALCENSLIATDIPFATAVFPISDACSSQRHELTPEPSTTITNLSRNGSGRYCLNGEVSTGFALFIVSFDHINDLPTPAVHGPLNAQALDIHSLLFTLDTPPASGLQVSLSYVVEDDCPAERTDCVQVPGFYIMDTPEVPHRFSEGGTYSYSLSDFTPGPGSALGATLDTTRLVGLQFSLAPGAFDFCVHEVELIDTAGNRVEP